ncbi:hypothetical protein [Paenibacillus sp. 1P07SE]|uniref:hypothetical protein n=1 Tax=Paenibacillus sp. 1P07SE TaxID=3132209 RepID=UPI0039A5A10A
MKRKRIWFILGAVVVVIVFLYASPWTNPGSDTAIEAIEVIRKPGAVEHVVYEDRFKHGSFVYYLRDMAGGSPTVAAEYVSKTWSGKWKWGFGGSHGGTHISLYGDNDNDPPISYQYIPAVDEDPFIQPFPVLFGSVFNAEISSVVVKDSGSGDEQQAELVPVNDTFALYYAYVDESDGTSFELLAYDDEGKILFTETYHKSARQGNKAVAGQKG